LLTVLLGASAAIAQEGGTARRFGCMAIILAAVLAVAPAAADEYKTFAFAMATVGGSQQMCAVKANLGVIAALAAVRVADVDEAAFQSEVKAQVKAINEDVAKIGVTGWCLAAVRRFGPHGVDMPGLLTAP
jgi:hypothetical protein